MLFVRQEYFSLLTFVHRVSAPEKNASSNPWSKRRGHAGFTCCLIFSLLGPVVLMLHEVENVLV